MTVLTLGAAYLGVMPADVGFFIPATAWRLESAVKFENPKSQTTKYISLD
jgi:hypothetical protein